MQITISGCSYTFSSDVLSRQDMRESYFNLAKTVFNLDFNKWYNSGFWDNNFIPYVLYDSNLAVSSVGVCINDVERNGKIKRYVQISTVMTLPEYRAKGLNRRLMEYVPNEWKDKCDAVYLLANDSVVNFYPKFGFEEHTEYDFIIQAQKTKGEYIKLDLNKKDDLELLIKKYNASNPFAELKVKNFSQFMFHCLYFLSDNIYYIEKYDAIVIIEQKEEKWICYDILTDFDYRLSEILGIIVNDSKPVYLGFTPKMLEDCHIQKSDENNNHLFVLKGKENVWENNKILLPLLSRA